MSLNQLSASMRQPFADLAEDVMGNQVWAIATGQPD
jgi:hypothetical protein